MTSFQSTFLILTDGVEALAKTYAEQRSQLAQNVCKLDPDQLLLFGLNFVHVVWTGMGFAIKPDDIVRASAEVRPYFESAAPTAYKMIKEEGEEAAEKLVDFIELGAVASALEARVAGAECPEDEHVKRGLEKVSGRCPFKVDGLCPPFWSS